MCDSPLLLSFRLNLAAEILLFWLMLIVCRLSLSPLFDIASMMLLKEEDEDLLLVFLFLIKVSSHHWKLNVLVLYLRADPKSSAVEQWMLQLSKISLSALQLAFTICSNSASLNSKKCKNTSSVVAFANFISVFM